MKLGDTVQLAYVDQSRDTLDPTKTVYEEITDGVEHMKVGNREIHGRAYVASFNFKGSDQQKNVGELSGGERNRVHLAKVLKSGGNVLLLDEPTNDLDVDTLRALEDALDAFPGCAVVISHDRWFLDRIATHVLAFEGDSYVRWFEGNFTEYEAFRRKQLGARRRHSAPHPVQAAGAMTLRVLRWAVIAICVVGIAGMIIGSIADNNNGVVVTFGLITAVSIIVLMAVAATARSAEARRGEVDESLAAEVEDRVQAIVAAGADETAIRDLVGRAVRLGRSRGR